MKSTARKKPVVVPPPPSLEDRVRALMDELDEALDALAAELQGPGHQVINAVGEPELVRLPVLSLRRELDARGFGDCRCRAYLAAMKTRQPQ